MRFYVLGVYGGVLGFGVVWERRERGSGWCGAFTVVCGERGGRGLG